MHIAMPGMVETRLRHGGARHKQVTITPESPGPGKPREGIMDRIRIIGGQRLEGSLPISGAKNAALPVMIASLLTPDRLTLKNVPNLADVSLLARILRNHGVDHSIEGKRAGPTLHLGETYHLTARDIVDTTAPYEMVSRMRASFWVLAP